MTGTRGWWVPYTTATMALYSLVVGATLLVSGWVEPWWLVSAVVVWLIAMVGYTVRAVRLRQQRQWQRQDR